MNPELASALEAAQGVVRRREHPGMRHALDAALQRGELIAVLPGVYAAAADAAGFVTRARAACRVDPDAVVVGEAAAFVLGWVPAEPPEVTVATLRLRTPCRGFRWERRRIPAGLHRVHDGYRIATKAMTALDLTTNREDALELALRKGVTPAELTRALALTPHRRGNADRRRQVTQTSEQPWSPAERKAHAALRRARISGWQANRALYDRRGEVRLGYGDLVFAAYRLVIEIDGDTHRTSEGWSRDAARDLALARAGWEVVRIPASVVLRSPKEFVAIVRELLDARAARLRPQGDPAPRA